MIFIHYSRLQLGFHIKLFSARLTRKVMVFIRAAFLRKQLETGRKCKKIVFGLKNRWLWTGF
jgi:hypothetical protein